MNYLEVFNQSWKIIKKHKVLWLLGFLAGCGAASGGGSVNLGQTFSSDNFLENSDFYNFMQRNFHINLYNQEQILALLASIAVVLLVAGLCLGLITLVLRTVGRGGLARAAWDADEGKSEILFGDMWRHGLKKFWHILLFSLLMVLVDCGLFILLALPVLGLTLVTLGCGLILILPILTVIGWLAVAWYQFGVVAIAVEEMEVMDAFRYAFNLTIKNIGKVLLVSVIMAAISFFLSIIFAIPLVLVLMPAIIAVIAEASSIGIWVALSGVLLIVYILVMIVLGSVITAYFGTLWTLFYRRLIDQDGRVSEIQSPMAPQPYQPSDSRPLCQDTEKASDSSDSEGDTASAGSQIV